MTVSPDGKNEKIRHLEFYYSFLLSCQMILTEDIPIPLLLVLLKLTVIFPWDSNFAMSLLAPRPLTPSWLLRSVITYLITLLSYSHIAHCSAKLSGCCWVLAAWSLTIPFNANSPNCLKNYSQIQISACSVGFGNACSIGRIHPHPLILGKHSLIIAIRSSSSLQDRFICERGWDSFTQHSNDKYSYRQLMICCNLIPLSLISFADKLWPNCVCIAQINTKLLPTCSDPQIVVPLVIPLHIDMRGKSHSLCCCASHTMYWCKSSNDSRSCFLDCIKEIKHLQDIQAYI